MQNVNFDAKRQDFGREVAVRITGRQKEEYYYGTFDDGKLIWHRQGSECEPKPAIICYPDEARLLASAIDKACPRGGFKFIVKPLSDVNE